MFEINTLIIIVCGFKYCICIVYYEGLRQKRAAIQELTSGPAVVLSKVNTCTAQVIVINRQLTFGGSC